MFNTFYHYKPIPTVELIGNTEKILPSVNSDQKGNLRRKIVILIK